MLASDITGITLRENTAYATVETVFEVDQFERLAKVMMLTRRYPHQQQQQQPHESWSAGSGRRPSTWPTSLRERLQSRRTTARRWASSSRLIDATWCPWNGAIYRSINRWHNSWTLLDNPVHVDDALRSADGTDVNGEARKCRNSRLVERRIAECVN